MCTLALAQEYSTAESLCKSQSVRVCACVCVYASPPPTTYIHSFGISHYVIICTTPSRTSQRIHARRLWQQQQQQQLPRSSFAFSFRRTQTRVRIPQPGSRVRRGVTFAGRLVRCGCPHFSARTLAVLARFWHARSYVEQPTRYSHVMRRTSDSCAYLHKDSLTTAPLPGTCMPVMASRGGRPAHWLLHASGTTFLCIFPLMERESERERRLTTSISCDSRSPILTVRRSELLPTGRIRRL